MPPDRAQALMTQFAIHTPVQGLGCRRADAPPRRRPALFTPSIFFESPGAAVIVSPMMQQQAAADAALPIAGACDGLLRSLLDRFLRCGASPDMLDATGFRTSPSLDGSPPKPTMVSPPAADDAASAYQQGSSCHQCKSRRLLSELSFCNNVTKKRSPQQSPRGEHDTLRSHCCRKKYCGVCLKKFYGEKRGPDGASWPCPSCRLICTCAACRRQKLKAPNIPERFLNSSSPATAVACSIVYFGNELGGLLIPDALKLVAPQQAGRSTSPVRTISFRSEVVQASVADGAKRTTKMPPNGKPKKLKMDDALEQLSAQEDADAESERVEKEATAEAAILLASLRTIIPNTIPAS